MSIHGYKPYSHETTIAFVKEYYSEHFNEEDISLFDRFRKLRADSAYRAVPIASGDANAWLIFAEKVKKIVGQIFHVMKKEHKGD
jgi:hypothetical protein